MKKAAVAIALVVVVAAALLGGMSLAGARSEGSAALTAVIPGSLEVVASGMDAVERTYDDPRHFHLTLDLPPTWADYDLIVMSEVVLGDPKAIEPVTAGNVARTYEFEGWGFAVRLVNRETTSVSVDYIVTATWPR